MMKGKEPQDLTDNERNKNLLTAIIEGSEDAIVSKDLNGIITSWNPGAENIFGYTADEAIGQSVTMLIPSHLRHEEDMILKKIRNGSKVEHYDTVRQHKDGSFLDISLTVSPVFNKEGEIVGASKIARNITERKKAKEKLKKTNKKLEERTQSLLSYQKQLRSLASKLHKAEENERQRLATELHDNLGQLLAVGKMKVDLLTKEKLPDEVSEDIKEIQQVMNEALVYTRKLMSDLKPPPSLNKEDVRESIKWVAGQIGKRGLKVDIDDDGVPKQLPEDIRTTLFQSVRELLQNVRNHSGVNEAKVRMSCQDSNIKVAVEDKGKGFDPDKEALKPTPEGGLGLFNIKERVDLIDGEVTIDSEHGRGTKVTITIPLHRQDSPERESAEPEEKGFESYIYLYGEQEIW